MDWTLEQMRHFVAAAETGSFSAAARRLGRAQSAVSTAIALLEADLGISLFDRGKRHPVLTEAGEVLLVEARQLLRQAAGLQQRALSFSAGQQARLGLAVDEALPDLVMDALLDELSRRFPALELTLLSGTASEVADYVERGRASLASISIAANCPPRWSIATSAACCRAFTWAANIPWPGKTGSAPRIWPAIGSW